MVAAEEKAVAQGRGNRGFGLLLTIGALGKAICGWLGQHLDVVWSVVVTEAATALLMAATLPLLLVPLLVVWTLLLRRRKEMHPRCSRKPRK